MVKKIKCDDIESEKMSDEELIEKTERAIKDAKRLLFL